MTRLSRRQAMFHLLAAAGTVLVCAEEGRAQPNAPRYISGRYIVVLKEAAGDPIPVAERMARERGFRVDHIYRSALRGYVALIPDLTARRLARDPRVAYVEQDQVVTTTQGEGAEAGGNGKPGEGGGGGGGGTQPAQTMPWGIRRIGGHLSSTISGDGGGGVDIDIAIIDSGIEKSHPDLNVVGGRNFSGGNAKDYSDRYGHGTHVAGTAAALDNAIGVVGVAPGARLWAVKVLGDNGLGSVSSMIAGVDWVTAHGGIEVANMSLRVYGRFASLDQAIENSVASGVTYAVSAGNDFADSKSQSPANHTSAGVITVSSLSTGSSGEDILSYYSNYGLNFDLYDPDDQIDDGVDVIAPGSSTKSTYLGGTYTFLSGTSMASPHVAGVAALYIAANPGADPAEVKRAVINSAPVSSLGTLFGYTYGLIPWCVASGDPDGFFEPIVNAAAY